MRFSYNSSREFFCPNHDAVCGPRSLVKRSKATSFPLHIYWPGYEGRFPVEAVRQHWPGLYDRMRAIGNSRANVLSLFSGYGSSSQVQIALTWIFNRIDRYSRETCRYRPMRNNLPLDPFENLIEIIEAAWSTNNPVAGLLFHNAMEAVRILTRILREDFLGDSRLVGDFLMLAEDLVALAPVDEKYILARSVYLVCNQSVHILTNLLRRIDLQDRDLLILTAEQEFITFGDPIGFLIFKILT